MSCLLKVLLILVVLSPSVHAEEWLQWRGPTGDNHAAAGATAPVAWSKEQNLAWLVPLPGRGHSSPTVVGERIYLTTADEENQTQSLLVLDLQTGKKLHETVVHRGGLSAKLHNNNTHATSTVASDGQQVYAVFNNDYAAWVTAFDLNGKQLWQERAIGYEPQKYQYGFGSSPVLVDGLVVVSSEYDGDESGIVALDAKTGKQRWKVERPQSVSYSTPARAVLQGKVQLLMSGNNKINLYEPATGNQLWATDATTFATCGTMICSERLGLAFASGGFPATFTQAVRTTGDHEIVWSNNRIRCYEQSLLLVDDLLFAVSDRGIANCLRATDGELLWKERLEGKFSSSPVLVDGKVYVSNERGKTFVFAATGESFQSLGENQLGTECFATPTPIGNRLYHRFAEGTGENRKEYLAAISEEN